MKVSQADGSTLRHRVYLDDVPQVGVLEADDVAGYVVRVASEVVAGRRTFKTNGGRLTSERVTGKVRIEEIKPAATK